MQELLAAELRFPRPTSLRNSSQNVLWLRDPRDCFAKVHRRSGKQWSFLPVRAWAAFRRVASYFVAGGLGGTLAARCLGPFSIPQPKNLSRSG